MLKISGKYGFLVMALTMGACSGGDKDSTSDGTSDSTSDSGSGQALQGADIAGGWVSTGCEAYDNGQGGENYLTRSFDLTDSTWGLDLVIYGDAACSYPLFSIRIDGPYSLGARSTVVDGATEGTFGFASNVWTALDQGMADTFTGAGCGAEPWTVGTPQDVSGTGCIGVAHPIAECPEEYDVIALSGGQLFFGERVTDMCQTSGRPTALNSYGLDSK